MNQREAFEKWADSKGLDLDREGDSYYETEAHFSWSAWQAAQQAQWLPIDTAPRDGSFILAFTAAGACEVVWDGYSWVQQPCYSNYDGCGFAVLHCQPTHWMPLPPEPKK